MPAPAQPLPQQEYSFHCAKYVFTYLLVLSGYS